MKITMEETASHGVAIGAVEPGRWDGLPRRARFSLDMIPTGLEANRVAVAATLLFGEYFGGNLEFQERINIVTAGAVARYCEPARVFPHNLDEGPKPIALGNGSLSVGVFAGSVASSTALERRTLQIADSTEFRGSLIQHRGGVVGTNAVEFDLDKNAQGPVGSLAAAVLFAAHFHASAIELTIDSRAAKPWLGKAQDLLGSVGLSIIPRSLKED